MPRLASLALFLTVAVTAHAADAPPANLLPDGSKWAGMQLRDETHAQSTDEPCHFHITKRDGEKFAADFWSDNNGLRVEGTVSDSGAVKCVPVEVIKGKWQSNILKDVWTGTATADSLTLLRPRTGKGGSFMMELKPDDNDGKKKRKKK
jgi:hypothetical protein